MDFLGGEPLISTRVSAAPTRLEPAKGLAFSGTLVAQACQGPRPSVRRADSPASPNPKGVDPPISKASTGTVADREGELRQRAAGAPRSSPGASCLSPAGRRPGERVALPGNETATTATDRDVFFLSPPLVGHDTSPAIRTPL